MLVKIQTDLNKQEDVNQELLKSISEREKKEVDFKDRIDTLEIALARGDHSGNDKDYHESPEYKAMNQLCILSDAHLDDEQKQLLRTDDNVSGGYLVMGEMDNTIIKKITEISNIRGIARVRTIASKTIEMPTRTSILTSAFEGEAEAGIDSTSLYGSEQIVPFRQSVTVPITKDMLMDANFDMESEILGDASEAFAQNEGAFHVGGDGFKKPEGFLVDPTILGNLRISSTSGVIEAADVILLTGDLKTGYNPTYVMNRRTLADLRTKVSTDGVFLWQPGLNGPVANTINGFPYILANDMPDIAGDSLSIAFGDFLRGYTIIDRTGVSVVRDEVTRKREAIIEFTIHRWTTGQVTLPEAIKVLKTLT